MRWLVTFALKRGWPTWVLPVAVYLAVALACAGLVMFIYDSGVTAERDRWVAKENAELVKAQAEVIRLKDDFLKLERRSRDEAASRLRDYELGVENAKIAYKTELDALRSGAKRLSVTTKNMRACEGGNPPAASSASVAYTETRAELSSEAAEAVLSIGHDADQVTLERNQCVNELLACHEHYSSVQATLGGM